ncbi:MAG: hypothetical protein ABUK01_13810 [Leptospirales bacterium]
MKSFWIVSCILTLCLAVAPSVRGQSSCNTDSLTKEKNLKKVYYGLRSMERQCRILPEAYLQYSESALLAERFNEALWATMKGLEQQQNNNVGSKLKLNQGLAFLGQDRNEEAIIILKELTLKKNTTNINEDTKQRSHMALIQAYYQKNKRKADKNVEFLVNLFYHRYPDSQYTGLLKYWGRQNGTKG